MTKNVPYRNNRAFGGFAVSANRFSMQENPHMQKIKQQKWAQKEIERKSTLKHHLYVLMTENVPYRSNRAFGGFAVRTNRFSMHENPH
jgi:hypothetical protein